LSGNGHPASDLSYSQSKLSEEDRRLALAWWQRGEHYHPIACPICGAPLAPSAQGVALECPTNWCTFTTDEIPWAVFVAYQKHKDRKEADAE
jgi:hypothetical protein